MKTAILIGILVAALGCTGESADYARDAFANDASVDSAPDLGDACVMAQGNCGCVFVEDIHYNPDGTHTITNEVVCP